MIHALAVAAGGAVGAVGRWWMHLGLTRLVGDSWPAGTFAVNVVGSFAIGAIFAWAQGADVSETTRLFLTMGLLGSFTTFSTFTFETLVMLQTGAWARAGVYVTASVLLGVACVAAGMAVAARVT